MTAEDRPSDKGRVVSVDYRHALLSAAMMGGIVFAAAIFGIFTRPHGYLAAVWPANAVMLGVLIRCNLAVIPSYAGALAGYLLADLITGTTFFSTALLTAANLTGVAVGHALFQRIPETDRRLQQPYSVLYLLLIASTASAATGVVGAIANPLLFNKDALTGGVFWFATELVNFLIILPVIQSAPDLNVDVIGKLLRHRERRHDKSHDQLLLLLPALSLVLSGILALVIRGPGSVAFPIPALLWCALTYRVWTTSLLTLAFCFIVLMLIPAENASSIVDANAQSNSLSMRLGVALMSIGPLTVASVMAARNSLVEQLERLASYDSLTGVLNKRAFHERACAQLAELAERRAPFAVLMFDIDRFKSINDTYGHAAGDQILSTFAGIARVSLRDNDLIGRLGGEEFGALIPYCSRESSLAIAERIRSEFALTATRVAGGNVISATVSIGISHSENGQPNLEARLAAADAALYRAKREGRNRVESD